MENVNIVISTDNNYAQFTAVVITSLFENKTEEYIANIYIVNDDLSEINQSNFHKLALVYDFNLKFISMETSLVDDLISINNDYGKAAYFRLFLPDIFANIDKLLYIDCDVLIRSDILELYKTDISNSYLAAVVDPCVQEDFDHKKALKMKNNDDYFNSGVLLVNAKKWREENIGNKVKEFILLNPSSILFADQDGLNGLLSASEWVRLDPKWNLLLHYYYYMNCDWTCLNEKELKAINKPFIAHYAGPEKYWNHYSVLPYLNEAKKYIKLTPWGKFERNISLGQLLNEFRRSIRKKIRFIRKHKVK